MFLVTRRRRNKLIAAKTAKTPLQATLAATSMFSFMSEPDGAYRRGLNALMTYDGAAAVTAGEITIEPIGV